MVQASLADGSEPIVVAPPPVYEPCTGNGGLECDLIDGRLADLSVALDNLAFQEDVAFVDLYTLVDEHPDPPSLFNDDGVHPNHDVGDPFIADAILPELAEIFCGDGSLDPGEECDDGNTDPGTAALRPAAWSPSARTASTTMATVPPTSEGTSAVTRPRTCPSTRR